MNVAPLTYLSLFAGVDMLGVGFELAFPTARCIGRVEIGLQASEVLAARVAEDSIDEAPQWSDVRTFPSQLYRGRVAAILAGFPCPDYSVAGKRAGIVGKHGQLWDDLAAVIRDVGPDTVWLENVPGISLPHRSDTGEWTLPAGMWFVLGDLSSLGFDAEWVALRASDVGASHGRLRWFCLGIRRNMAVRKGRRCGELRQPSGRHGQPDGRDGDLVAVAKHRGVCQADSGNGFIQEPRRRSSGRDGAGSASEVLGESKHAERGSEYQEYSEASGRSGSRRTGDCLAITDGTSGVGMANTDSARLDGTEGRGELPERQSLAPARSGYGLGELGHSDDSGLEGRRIGGSGRGDERTAGPANGQVGKTVGEGQAFTGCLSDERRGGSGVVAGASGSVEVEALERKRSGDAVGRGGDRFLFAPGPDNPVWQSVLVREPWLRPSLSQAEVESIVHGMVDELADLVVHNRTDALRACGNGCVPSQVAIAFIALAKRANVILCI